jgi:hypothetical protein
MAALSASGKRDLVNCAECCTTSPGDSVPCNARLCGQQCECRLFDIVSTKLWPLSQNKILRFRWKM